MSGGFDPDKTYYKMVDSEFVAPPYQPDYVPTNDPSPVDGKTYYIMDPGEYEEARIDSFASLVQYYTRNSSGVYTPVARGTQFDSNETYYEQTRPSSGEYIEANVSGGFQQGVAYFEASPYGVWFELEDGQGVGYEQYQKNGDGLVFQIGANGVEDQKLYVTIDDMSSGALGISDISVAEQDDANTAIDKIDEALKDVSAQRAKLGAVQNRLEHTVSSLNTSNENLTDSESRIRDTDVASEMVEYNKINILQQASQSMLSQANQQPNGVLSLLG